MPNRRTVLMLAAAIAVASTGHGAIAQVEPAPRPGTRLEFAYTGYADGDHAVVARIFTQSLEFQSERLTNRRRLTRWLGPFERQKAAFLLELANQSSLVAPAYTIPLLTAGREYLATRPAPTVTKPGEDAFERLWHQVAIGILERRLLTDAIEEYIASVEQSSAAADRLLRGRLLLGRAVAQEQRCWHERPVLMRVGTPINELRRAAVAPAGSGPASAPIRIASDVTRRLACLGDAAARFEAAAATGIAPAEVRLRLGWVQFQMGDIPAAVRSLEAVEADDDVVRYWTALFQGRIATATGRHADAERAYRRALEIRPEAQSAAVGLALTLFSLDRIEEANAAALAVRGRAIEALDPWWAYLSGDSRSVDAWLQQLRAQP